MGARLGGLPMSADAYYVEDEEWGCSWCGGDAWEECDDWIQCTYRDCDGETHPCTACGGSGNGKDQTIW